MAMKNSFTGFQASKLAMPKAHTSIANKEFNIHKAPATLKRPVLRMGEPKLPKKAPRMPGKNPGTRL